MQISIYSPKLYSLDCAKEIEIIDDLDGSVHCFNLQDFLDTLIDNQSISEMMLQRILTQPTPEVLATTLRVQLHPSDLSRLQEALA